MTLVKKPKNREDVRKSLFCIHNALHSPIVHSRNKVLHKSSKTSFRKFANNTCCCNMYYQKFINQLFTAYYQPWRHDGS